MICDGDYGAPLMYVGPNKIHYQIGLATYIYNHSPICNLPVCGCVNMQGSHLFLYQVKIWIRHHTNVSLTDCSQLAKMKIKRKRYNNKLKGFKNIHAFSNSRCMHSGIYFTFNILAILFVKLSVFLICQYHFI